MNKSRGTRSEAATNALETVSQFVIYMTEQVTHRQAYNLRIHQGSKTEKFNETILVGVWTCHWGPIVHGFIHQRKVCHGYSETVILFH